MGNNLWQQKASFVLLYAKKTNNKNVKNICVTSAKHALLLALYSFNISSGNKSVSLY